MSYAFILSKGQDFPLYPAIVTAILVRLILVLSFPNLSDDIYRFIWDGNCIHAGINPYSLLPSELLTQGIPGNTPALYHELNSPDYYTVYPPLSQLIFYLGTIGDIGWYGSSVIMKLFMFAAEVGSLFLIFRILAHLGLDRNKALIYALNPLIIIELVGNLHFEALTVFFVLLGIYALARAKIYWSSAAIALGVSAKMLPLMFIPFFWKYNSHAKNYILFFSLCLILLFTPILLGLELANFGQSLDLYFGKFEFNGSIYLLLRTLGKWISGYNLIRYLGPVMALGTVILILRWYLAQRPKNMINLIHACFYSITAYYFLSTTVHPWYLALPLVLSVFTSFRFVTLWSGLIMLSYINYSYAEYKEIFLIQWIEYGIVFLYLAYELYLVKDVKLGQQWDYTK